MTKKKSEQLLWFINLKGVKEGPFEFEEIAKGLKSGIYNLSNYISRSDANEWQRIVNVPEFKKLVKDLSQGKLKCPNCFTKVPVSAEKCPSCKHILKEEIQQIEKKSKIHWLSRITIFGGFIMLISLFFPWINVGEGFTKNCLGITGFSIYFTLSLIIIAFSAQNLLRSRKRFLIPWLLALSGLLIVLIFTSDLSMRSAELINHYSITTQKVIIPTQTGLGGNENSLNILGLGIFIYASGTILVLLSLIIPMIFELVKKPRQSIIVFLILFMMFLGNLQLINGNAYNFLFKLQLNINGYDVVKVDRLYDVDSVGLDKKASFEIFAKKELVDSRKSSINEYEYFYGLKTVKLGTFELMNSLELSKINKEDLSLYPEFTKLATEGTDEDN